MTEYVKIKCDDCKFVGECVDYGWEGCRKFTQKTSESMTNEEWIRSCSTEELREFLFNVFGQGAMFGETHEKVPMFPDDEVVTVSVFDWWLKEKHK